MLKDGHNLPLKGNKGNSQASSHHIPALCPPPNPGASFPPAPRSGMLTKQGCLSPVFAGRGILRHALTGGTLKTCPYLCCIASLLFTIYTVHAESYKSHRTCPLSFLLLVLWCFYSWQPQGLPLSLLFACATLLLLDKLGVFLQLFESTAVVSTHATCIFSKPKHIFHSLDFQCNTYLYAKNIITCSSLFH